jgi:hypothetical protein
VVRDATTGAITTIYNQPVNLNLAKNQAWDFSLDYQWATPIGSLTFGAAETIEEHVQRQLTRGGPLLEYVGYPNSGGVAKSKANANLRWAFRNWVASWSTTYFGGYKQNGAPGDPQYQGNPNAAINFRYIKPQGGYAIPTQVYHNVYLSYVFRKRPFTASGPGSRIANVLLGDSKLSLNINNVFNTLPPFDAYYYPFLTSAYGDLQLRNYSVTLRKTF